MKLQSLLLAPALAALAVSCAAQRTVTASGSASPRTTATATSRDSVEACSDTTITGNAGMSRQAMLETERQSWPDPSAREDYRLQMLAERLGAFERETGREPQSLYDFAAREAEVPWLNTCDPWGHRIRFHVAGDGTFQLRSAGPDAAFGTADDLVREGLLAHHPHQVQP